jgi:hypothetical protein
LKRGGQRTPAAPYPVGLIRAGTNGAWICWSGSAASCPAAPAGMLAGAGALGGCSGRGRRICQGLGVSGVVIDSTPGNGVEPQWDATIGTAPGGVGGCSTRLSCGRGSSRRPGYPIVGAAGQIRGKQGRAPSLCGPCKRTVKRLKFAPASWQSLLEHSSAMPRRSPRQSRGSRQCSCRVSSASLLSTRRHSDVALAARRVGRYAGS